MAPGVCGIGAARSTSVLAHWLGGCLLLLLSGHRQINTPIYPPFLWTPKTAGMRVTGVPLVFDEARQDWAMDYEAMERLVTERTKMFILCNPHNPVRHGPGLD